MTNPLRALQRVGQSIWLDYIRRNLIISGELYTMMEEDGLRGVTSNPAIFEKAITGSSDYLESLHLLRDHPGITAESLYEHLALRDIQDAASTMLPVYGQTNRRDGYVSLEISPYLSQNTQGTLEEARHLWKKLGQDNVMIKVPATPEGIVAVQQLIAEGINVNVTLLFSQEVYAQVAQAYIAGLETLAQRNGDLQKIASVASFFISRIDTTVDRLVELQIKKASSPREQDLLRNLLGTVAIANARQTYQRYKAIFSGKLWRDLSARGARSQRLLWASTGTKNPRYRDVLYVEELIGPDTVNTLPLSTYDAFRDHGLVRHSLEEGLEGAQATMETLERFGISMEQVSKKLLHEGLRLFAESFDKLLSALDKKCTSIDTASLNTLTFTLNKKLSQEVSQAIDDWVIGGKVRRLWGRDSSLWTGSDEGNWLGWLSVTEEESAHSQEVLDLAEEVKNEQFSHVLLLGMGGSSLFPEVLEKTFGKFNGYPSLHVLDSTDPNQIKSFEANIDLSRTLFIVSSKSGSTLEPNILKQYFFELLTQLLGKTEAGRHFIAITDPGSMMQKVAENDGFRSTFYGNPTIGGRYSALSNFGKVPGVLMGLDFLKFIDRAERMVHACTSCVPAAQNPGVILGTILGVLAKNGKDKVTIIASPEISGISSWLAQLLAESTGKEGKGLIPVDGEPIGSPTVYGSDRLFIYFRLESTKDQNQDQAIRALKKSGQPVILISVVDLYDLSQEFFRWEMAIAVAGSILEINPFDQPDVEASKIATHNLTAQYEKNGSLPAETSFFNHARITLFADEDNRRTLEKTAESNRTLESILKTHLGRLNRGDYFAILAYLEMKASHKEQLQIIRGAIRDKLHNATCLGFGPRFLHSTGQAYKGGPNSGVFLQITCEDSLSLPVPGQKYTFGLVKAAQAQGDFQVLAERQRRVLRVHLTSEIEKGLLQLSRAITQALG